MCVLSRRRWHGVVPSQRSNCCGVMWSGLAVIGDWKEQG